MNPTRVLTTGFFAESSPHLVWVHADRQRIARRPTQRREIQVRYVRTAESRPKSRLDRFVEFGMLHASGNQRNGHDLIGHRIGDHGAVDDRHAFGNLAQHIPQRYAQGRGDCFEQFRGCLLLPTLNFGEVTQGHLRLGRDLAQGSVSYTHLTLPTT